MRIASRGATMAVDWEQRVDFDRLRRARLENTKRALAASDLGALLLFDPNNIRYVTSTAIGTWERDKNIRYARPPRRRPDPLGLRLRRAPPPAVLPVAARVELARVGVADARRHGQRDRHPQALAALIHGELSEQGLAGEPLGIDVPDTTTLLALQAGIHVADSQPVMLSARKIKTEDELALLDHAAGIVDAVYEVIYRMLRPGVTENEVVAAAMKVLFELGSEHVEAINAISGDRCNPAPAHVRRPAAAAGRSSLLRHHPLVHGLPDVLLPHVQRQLRDAVPARRLQAVP